jgi:hypothetical protein
VRRARALAVLVAGILAPWPACAAEWEVLSVGLRAQVWEQRVLGKEQPESFNEYDLVAAMRLPWDGPSFWGFEVNTRLLASAGVLQGADKTAFVASAIPAIAFIRRDVPITVEFGAGLALISEHRFGEQDYGGPLQFALTLSVGVPLYKRVGIAYRLMHYSDASAYGSHTIGADLHMLELTYNF